MNPSDTVRCTSSVQIPSVIPISLTKSQRVSMAYKALQYLPSSMVPLHLLLSPLLLLLWGQSGHTANIRSLLTVPKSLIPQVLSSLTPLPPLTVLRHLTISTRLILTTPFNHVLCTLPQVPLPASTFFSIAQINF